MACKLISSAFLPLKLPERGRPVEGAVDSEWEDEEGVGPDDEGIEAEWEEAGGMVEVAMAARYWMTFLVFSVLPAPDSPLTMSAPCVPTLCSPSNRPRNRDDIRD